MASTLKILSVYYSRLKLSESSQLVIFDRGFIKFPLSNGSIFSKKAENVQEGLFRSQPEESLTQNIYNLVSFVKISILVKHTELGLA